MEGDKEAYLEEASKALKRQRKILDELLAEKNGIQRQLRVTKSKQNRNKDAENAAKIARLAEEQDTLIIMIKREIQALKDLGQDHLVSFRRSDVLAHHDRAGGIFVHLDMFQPTAIQCTEVRFENFLSGGFTTMTVINPPEMKLAKRTCVFSQQLMAIHNACENSSKSTLNIDLILWHTQLIVCAVKC